MAANIFSNITRDTNVTTDRIKGIVMHMKNNRFRQGTNEDNTVYLETDLWVWSSLLS